MTKIERETQPIEQYELEALEIEMKIFLKISQN